LPSRTCPLILTALTITGIIIGKSKIGSSTSLSLVLSAIAEKSVPTETNPTAPRKMTGIKGIKVDKNS
jgi:hypothetical protein